MFRVPRRLPLLSILISQKQKWGKKMLLHLSDEMQVEILTEFCLHYLLFLITKEVYLMLSHIYDENSERKFQKIKEKLRELPYSKSLKMKITVLGRGTLKTEFKMNHRRKKRESYFKKLVFVLREFAN